MKNIKDRIWELDFVRGVAILSMVLIHIPLMRSFYTDIEVVWNPVVLFLKNYGAIVFILISGILAGMGKGKNGYRVFIFGCLLTGLTYYLYLNGYETHTIIIDWGILHLIGLAKIISPAIKRLPGWIIACLALAIMFTGYFLDDIRSTLSILVIFGLRPVSYTCFDYFPICPNLGYFFIGMILGKTIYKEGKTLLPNIKTDNIVISFFTFLGRHCIAIYLIHLPIVYLVVKYFS